MRRIELVVFLAALATAALSGGCDGTEETDAGTSRDAATDAGPPRPPDTLGPAERRARFFTPPAHDGATALPLVVLLHGYTADATIQDLYFGLTRRARADGFYLLLPNGTVDSTGERYWDVYGLAVDDHAYLRGLIEEAMAVAPIDRGSVFVVGHSNGGFMGYRLACDSADLVTGVASLAGSDAIASCAPSADVSILQIHGTADDTVLYGGGEIAGLSYGAADEVVATWAARVGCTTTEEGAPLDLTSDVDGAETRILEHAGGCRAGAALYTMEGAGHIPALTDAFTPAVLDWLRAHPR